MPTAIKLPHMFHFNTQTARVLLLAVNFILLVLIALMLLTPVIDPASDWSDKKNLFAVLMIAGLALVPVSLLVSAYFVRGDPLAYPICKVVATYNILAAGFLFYHVANSPAIDALDLAYSIVIGTVAVLNTLALLFRLRKQTAPVNPMDTHPDRIGS